MFNKLLKRAVASVALALLVILGAGTAASAATEDIGVQWMDPQTVQVHPDWMDPQ